MTRLAKLLATAATLIAAGALPRPGGGALLAEPAPRASETGTAARVTASVRRAVGTRHIGGFGPGMAIAEAHEAVLAGTRHGEVRVGDEFGFDGAYRWQRDSRRGIYVPAPLRQHEKNAWPLWIRSHWWLNPRSGIAAEVVAAETNAQEIALRLRASGGVVPATVFVDRVTRLPTRFVVPYEHGPFTARLSDWRRVRGVLLPFAVDSAYRGRVNGRRVVSIAPIAAAGAFAPPPFPSDFRFDDAVPTGLETRAGGPLSPATPGHIYVRAAAEGRSGWWHFDSGSDSMIVDESVADALGMEVIGTHRSMGADGIAREGTWRRGRTFTAGPITIVNPVFRAVDLSANNAPPGERRMGTIGYDLFARSVVEYASGGHDVRVCDAAAYRLPRGGRWQPLAHIDATPAVPGMIGGRLRGLFQVDTGSAGTVDFTRSFHEEHGLLERHPTREMASLGSGGTFAVRVGRIASFGFAGRRFRNLEVSYRIGGVGREGSAGTVGRGLLLPFRTVFDYRNRRIAFVPRAAGPGRCGRNLGLGAIRSSGSE